MTTQDRIRAFLVEDEPLAREKLRTMLRKDSEIEIVGEAANGKQAVEGIEEQQPDLLFLDVQIPGIDGFQVLETLKVEKLPVIIFVTAYNQYALKAFEFYALDYLLKPFDRQRLTKAVDRAKVHIRKERGTQLNEGILELLRELKAKPKHLSRIAIRTDGRVFFVKAEEIDWIGAEGNYVSLHMGKESYLLRETITNMEGQMDPARFLRIHRSTIVNIDRVKELQPWFHGEYRVLLRDGTQLVLSRSYRDRFHETFGK
jgi:two-component system LytT family response regulator